jgi:hypothetical protein
MNRDNVRSPARSVANLEFHHTGDEVNDVARGMTAALERAGNRADRMDYRISVHRYLEFRRRIVRAATPV